MTKPFLPTTLAPALTLTLALAAVLPPPARATAPAAMAPVYGTQAQDRAAILAMAGNYKVTFDMRETVPMASGYTLYPTKVSGGYEAVRVVADRPDFVSLQHLLVVDAGGRPMVIKHWRQDWAWQPEQVLVYAGPGHWQLQPVAADARRGAWSQTVYQTDDSPRYGGLGRWRYDGAATRWTSDETSRPLARRDATRHPVYDHYLGVNRHALTPNGWVHEQDNAKIGPREGQPVTFAHETLVNSYVPASAAEFGTVAAADDYWAKTQGFWEAVRADWARTVAAGRGVRLAEEPETGSATGAELMRMADAIAAGTLDPARAQADARALIAAKTGTVAR